MDEIEGAKPVSYWLDTAPHRPDHRGKTLSPTADVVVIGGGLTGLSAALHLRERGARVVLLEKHRVGGGASGRNGGMCTPGLAVSPQVVVRRYGLDVAQRLHRAYTVAIDTVEDLVRANEIDCDFQRWGKLVLAAKPQHRKGIEEQQRVLAESFKHATEFIPSDRMAREVKAYGYHGGLLDRHGAGLHPGRFVVGLATAASRAGVEMHEQRPAIGIRRRPRGSFVVRTEGGSVVTEQVLVATNGYTDRVHPWVRRRVVPIGSFIIVTEPLGAELAEDVMPGRRMVLDTKNLLHYFRLTPDNRMLFGGRARFAISNPGSDRKSGAILHRALSERFPQLASLRVDYVWGGQVGFTLDRVPHAGEVDGVHYSLGYCGHGVQMATHMGRCMARVLDGEPEANPWHGLKFRAVPGHVGPPWFLPLAGSYYRAKDRFR